MRRLVRFAAILLWLLVLVGCGPSLATVTGTVTYDEKVVDEGWVTFTGEGGAAAGGPIKDGKYRVEKVTPGSNRVLVVGTKKVEHAQSSPDPATIKAGKVEPADYIAADATGNSAKHDIAAGDVILNLAIKKK